MVFWAVVERLVSGLRAVDPGRNVYACALRCVALRCVRIWARCCGHGGTVACGVAQCEGHSLTMLQLFHELLVGLFGREVDDSVGVLWVWGVLGVLEGSGGMESGRGGGDERRRG